jgi:hypothetical protein
MTTTVFDADDPAAYDRNGILRDGVTIRVSKMMRDGVQRQHDAGPIVHTGDGCRPGHIFSTDTSMRDAAEIARREYIDGLVNAWRRPSKKDKPSQFGGDGHRDPEIDDVRRPVLDAAEAERIRAEARDAYITYVTNAWRR